MTKTKATIDDLRQLRREFADNQSPTGELIRWLTENEIKRRSRGGRPKSDKSLLERNREAQRKRREGLRIKASIKKHLEENTEQLLAKARVNSVSPKLKKRRKKKQLAWQKVPQVKPDGLHY